MDHSLATTPLGIRPLAAGLLLFGLLGCSSTSISASRSRTGWQEFYRAEEILAEAARQAAWTPDFLTSPAAFDRLSAKDRAQKARLRTVWPMTGQLYWGTRLYVVGDPTENSDHIFKERVVFVTSDKDDTVTAEVVSATTFFPQAFAYFGQTNYDGLKEDLYDLVRLYLKVFGGTSAFHSRANIISSAGDIRSSKDNPIPERVAKAIQPPIVEHRWVWANEDAESYSHLKCSFITWDDWWGVVKKWRIELRYYPWASKNSLASVSDEKIAETIGDFTR